MAYCEGCKERQDKIDELQELGEFRLKHIAELEAIVEKLPKTKDGAAVVPGMRLYILIEGIVRGVDVDRIISKHLFFCNKLDMPFNFDWCYSSREVAKAEQERKQ